MEIMKQNQKHERVFTSSLVRYAIHFGLLSLLACSMVFYAFAQQQRPVQRVERQQTPKKVGQGASPVKQAEIAQINPYSTIFYKSGNLNIEAYLYNPAGNGPFPLVIYNHGSRQEHERQENPLRSVAEIPT